MKVVPAIPFPSPDAGVVISEHPKKVGIQGAVDGSNLIMRDGSLVTRPGFVEKIEFDNPWSGVGAGLAPVALASFDYQKDGVNTRDRLLAVLENQIKKYNSDFSGAKTASYDELYDWSWDAVYGRGLGGASEPMVRMDDIEVVITDPDGINWSAFQSSSVLAIGLSIMMSPVTYTVRVVFHRVFSNSTDVLQPDVHDIPSSYLGDSGGYILPLVINDVDTHMAVQFNVGQEIIESYIYTGSVGKALIIKPAIWYKLYYNAQKWGLPDENSSPYGRGPTSGVVSFDKEDRPVVRTWDWGGQTHALIAAKGEWVLDVYEKETNTDLKVNTCGPVGGCPKALAIAIAGERVVAGNITYFNTSDVVADETNQNYILVIGPGGYPRPEFHRIDNRKGFAYVPDAVIFSQTVLQNGHRGWYPGDVLRLADTPGEIVALNEIGTMQCAVYKTDAIYVLTVQAGLAPFVPSLRASGIQGPVGPRAVTSITDTTHVYLGRDGGVYIFDGGPPKSMGEHIKTWISREIDPENAQKAFIIFNKSESEVWIIYPVRGSEGRAFKGVVIDIGGEGYTLHPIEFSQRLPAGWSHVGNYDVDYACAVLHFESGQPLRLGGVTVTTEEILGTAESTYPEILWGVHYYGTSLGYILKSQRGGSDLGVPIRAGFLTGTTDFGDPDSQKVLLEIEHLIDPKSEIYQGTEIEAQVTLYAGNSDRSLKQVDQQTIDLTEDPPYVSSHRTSARYFAYRLDLTCPASDEENGIRGEIAVGGGFARFGKAGYRNSGVSK